ncbi:uncharacterized protein LOC141640344 [Silene latifolia]|uniref:uncharacterized protein LOC141640344 n=1 Tax=Silene latifolia TaxID=37657 RepID=UPI003D77F3CB
MQLFDEDSVDLLQLSDEDVQDELEYWQNAVFGFIVGANPPWQVLEKFLQRIWSKYTLDKISFLPNGVFLVRFQTQEMKQAVLGSGHFLFDNKPMIIRPWFPDVELAKEEVKSVPAWIRMHKLPLKFWGKSLLKISNLVGNYVKVDEATEKRTRLGFARVMVELKLGQNFPKSVKFLDEKQELVEIHIDYEWKPSVCTKCKLLGHERERSKKGKPQKNNVVRRNSVAREESLAAVTKVITPKSSFSNSTCIETSGT